MDYPADVLHRPISFHKFWQIDPYDVYTKWLANYDDDRPTQSMLLDPAATDDAAVQPNQSRNQNGRRRAPNQNVDEITTNTRNIIKISNSIKNNHEL